MTSGNFGTKFEIVSRIGSGSFGEIYLARNKKTGEEVAVKVEELPKACAKSQLRREAKIYLKCAGEGIKIV